MIGLHELTKETRTLIEVLYPGLTINYTAAQVDGPELLHFRFLTNSVRGQPSSRSSIFASF